MCVQAVAQVNSMRRQAAEPLLQHEVIHRGDTRHPRLISSFEGLLRTHIFQNADINAPVPRNELRCLDHVQEL